MNSLTNKIDFAVIFQVKNANPNGDPLNGNRPRTNLDQYGEMTDVCIKRKIRDRLIERYLSLSENERIGQNIFVHNDYRIDQYDTLSKRYKQTLNISASSDINTCICKACMTWFDVRSFGQLFAFKSEKKNSNKKNKNDEENIGEEKNKKPGISIPVRGPVSIHSAFSIDPINITSMQITKIVNSEENKGKKSSDTMGMKHRVDHGIYVFYGSMNPQLAEKTGFNDQDAQVIKTILPKLFENDASSARPEGSMNVLKVVWWDHQQKTPKYSSAKVHASITIEANGNVNDLQTFPNLKPEMIDGF